MCESRVGVSGVSEPRKSSKGRIAAVVDGPLWPTPDPLAMIVEGRPGPRLTGWRAGAPNVEIAPVDAWERPIHPGSDFISPGGRSIVTELWSRPSPDLPREHRAPTFQGIFRTDLSTGESQLANYTIKGGFKRPKLGFGLSPNSHRVLIMEAWLFTGVPIEPSHEAPLRSPQPQVSAHPRLPNTEPRWTLSVCAFDDSPPQEVMTFSDLPRARSYSGDQPLDAVWSCVQWSPDGSLVAAWMPIDVGGFREGGIRVFDTTSWTEVAQFPSAYLAGTASWGPKSDRLLFERYRSDTNEREVWIQHLDGSREEVAAIPKPNREGISKVRPLGLADNNRLVTVRTTKTKATIALTSATTGEHQDVLTWPEHIDARPVIAQLPIEAWE